MAYSPSEKYPGAVDSDPNYQGGKFRDNNPPTTNNGSPLKAIDRNELLARDEAIMNDAGFEYSGVADTPQDSQLFKAYKASLGNGANLLSNHNFLIASPDDSQPAPSATPTSYPPGYQIFSGVFANETSGITNLTYVDGRVSFSGGDFYMAVPNTGAIARLTSDQLVASVADFDGKPRTRGVSFALVGDEYRVTVGIDALEDESANETLLGSVKFEQGSVATGHSLTEPLTGSNISKLGFLYLASYIPSPFLDNADITQFLKKAIDDAITTGKTLVGDGRSWSISDEIALSGNDVSANGLLWMSGNTKFTQTDGTKNGFVINGRGGITGDHLHITLPQIVVPVVGVEPKAIQFIGTAGWCRITEFVSYGGYHGIYSSGSAAFSLVFDKIRIYNTYSSHFKWLSDATDTTVSITNFQGDNVINDDYAFDVRELTTGNGIENLYVRMISLDQCTRAIYCRSRYAEFHQVYTERLRGDRWQSNFSAFDFGNVFEQPSITGLRATFSTVVPAGLSDLRVIELDGGDLFSVRVGGKDGVTPFENYADGMPDSEAYQMILSTIKPCRIDSITDNTGGKYSGFFQGPVFGLSDARSGSSSKFSIKPNSKKPAYPSLISGLQTTSDDGSGGGGSTYQAGLVFGAAPIAEGVVNNGAFTADDFTWSAILPFGDGANRKGGLIGYVQGTSTTAPLRPQKAFQVMSDATFRFSGDLRPETPNIGNVGQPNFKFDGAHFVNPPNTTSDKTLKTDNAEIPKYLLDGAMEVKRSIQIWRWIQRKKDKGNGARYHVGPMAQDVYDIFKKHMDIAGVKDDPFNYSFIGKDTLTESVKTGEKKVIIDGNEYIEDIYEDIPTGVDEWNIRVDDLMWLVLAAI